MKKLTVLVLVSFMFCSIQGLSALSMTSPKGLFGHSDEKTRFVRKYDVSQSELLQGFIAPSPEWRTTADICDFKLRAIKELVDGNMTERNFYALLKALKPYEWRAGVYSSFLEYYEDELLIAKQALFLTGSAALALGCAYGLYLQWQCSGEEGAVEELSSS